MKWMAGPPLPTHTQKVDSKEKSNFPIGYCKGTAYSLPGNVGIVYSGGASLKINDASASNQIYEYVPNTKVLMWRFDGTMHTNSWKVRIFWFSTISLINFICVEAGFTILNKLSITGNIRCLRYY